MRSFRHFLKTLAYKVLSPRRARILRRPMLVSGEYEQVVREIESVIALQIEGQDLDDEYQAQLLRKYTHIVDKGLQQPVWEPGHSLSYVHLALKALSQITSAQVRNDPSVVWAQRKLDEYNISETNRRPPVPRSKPPHSVQDYGSLLTLIQERRSIRWFEEKEVEKETIKRVIEGVNWSPTSCNRQPAKVFATNDLQLVRRCLLLTKGATGFSSFVPTFLCFCADMRPYQLPKEMWLPVIDACLGIQNCCLLAHSLGLSLTLLSWAHSIEEEERQLRALLDIPDYYHIVVNGVLGYPQVGGDVPLRKSMDSTLILRGQSRADGSTASVAES